VQLQLLLQCESVLPDLAQLLLQPMHLLDVLRLARQRLPLLLLERLGQVGSYIGQCGLGELGLIQYIAVVVREDLDYQETLELGLGLLLVHRVREPDDLDGFDVVVECDLEVVLQLAELALEQLFIGVQFLLLLEFVCETLSECVDHLILSFE